MTVTVGIDKNYTLAPGTNDVSSRSAIIHGYGTTALEFTWSAALDTLKTDTVNISADLTGAAASTPTASLTASLARVLQSASHVDTATGTREINQGISSTLASQVGQLLVAGGYSQTDAAQASASLIEQLSSTSSGRNVVSLSLASQNQTIGGYSTAVGGGTEVSAYDIQSTSALSISFDLGSGDLSVKLDRHEVAATQIQWSSATASDVSIKMTQPELEAVGFTPIGTSSNATGSPVREDATTTGNGVEGTGGSNVSGPDAISSLASMMDAASAPKLAAGSTVSVGSIPAGPSLAPATTVSAKQASAEAAVAMLRNIVAQLRAASQDSTSASRDPVKISITQQLGTVVIDQNGDRSLLYTQPSGSPAIVGMAGLKVDA